MGRGERPEHSNPPEIFYNEEEARKYTRNSRMIEIQTQLTERALELLALPQEEGCLLLDLGCGSGLSGQVLSERGHTWVGLDISPAMLDVAGERESDGDLCLHDLGMGLPFRTGTFDGAISISAVQWLCNAVRRRCLPNRTWAVTKESPLSSLSSEDSRAADPRKRMRRFFETLYACLVRGARAVLQMYPEDASQAELLTSAAMRAGFSGGLVVDFPHSTRAKKYFLVLMVGSTGALPPAKGVSGEASSDEEAVPVAGRASGRPRKSRKLKHFVGLDSARHPQARDKAWILKKKAQQRERGYTSVPPDTKYTGRKRKSRF